MPGDIQVRVAWSLFNGPAQAGTMTIRPNSNYVWFVSEDGKTQTLVSREVLRQARVICEEDQNLLDSWLRPDGYGDFTTMDLGGSAARVRRGDRQ